MFLLRKCAVRAAECLLKPPAVNLARQLQLNHGVHSSGSRLEYDMPGKTTLHSLAEDEEEYFMIDSYSSMGFRLNKGMKIIGSMAIFNKSVLSWLVFDVENITPESLEMFTLVEPKLDLLLVGCGEKGAQHKISKDVPMFLRSKGINMEILETSKACETFNFLNSEYRHVAGALIPPLHFAVTDADIGDNMQISRAGRYWDSLTPPAADPDMIPPPEMFQPRIKLGEGREITPLNTYQERLKLPPKDREPRLKLPPNDKEPEDR